jgi:hypothetical protein
MILLLFAAAQRNSETLAEPLSPSTENPAKESTKRAVELVRQIP